MAITINSGGNCVTDASGSGRVSCNIDLGLLKGTILTSRNWSLDMVSGTFTEEEYRNLIKDGVFFPYVGMFNFEQNNEENPTETAPNTGALAVIRSGLPSFNFIYNDGDCYHKSIYNKQGNKNYNAILVYERGIKLVEKNGKLKGFGTNMISVASYMERATESAKSTMTIQLDSADDYNKNFVVMTYDIDLGFDVNDTNGAIDVKLTIGTVTDTSIPVKVTAICNSSLAIDGLDDGAGWTVINNTTGSTITGVTVTGSVGGNYLIEGTGFPTTLGSLTVILNGKDAIQEIYKGKATK